MAKEYIERNALLAEYDRVHIGAPGGARKLIAEAPPADVVKVVRCKDCKYFSKHSSEREFMDGTCLFHWDFVKSDHFCSYGRRKENGL